MTQMPVQAVLFVVGNLPQRIEVLAAVIGIEGNTAPTRLLARHEEVEGQEDGLVRVETLQRKEHGQLAVGVPFHHVADLPVQRRREAQDRYTSFMDECVETFDRDVLLPGNGEVHGILRYQFRIPVADAQRIGVMEGVVKWGRLRFVFVPVFVPVFLQVSSGFAPGESAGNGFLDVRDTRHENFSFVLVVARG